MVLASHQPYFLPYLGYWQLIAASDLFLVGDDFSYFHGRWISRNRILVEGVPTYFRVELDHASIHRTIRDTRILDPSPDLLPTVAYAYRRAPHRDEGLDLLERILACPGRGLADFLASSISVVADYLGITTRMSFTSQFPGNSLLRREERIYDLCARTGARTYLNAPGGRALYHGEEFAARGVELRFLRPCLQPYPQHSPVPGRVPFVPGLSILDAVMNCPREEVRSMLRHYTTEP